MGDTGSDNAGDCGRGEGGTAVAISRHNLVYRCDCADDFFSHHAVSQANLRLGYAEAERAGANLYFYHDLPPRWTVAGPRAG